MTSLCLDSNYGSVTTGLSTTIPIFGKPQLSGDTAERLEPFNYNFFFGGNLTPHPS